jgi:hypothetical protein
MENAENFYTKPCLFFVSKIRYSLKSNDYDNSDGVFFYRKTIKANWQVFSECIIRSRRLLVVVDEKGGYGKWLKMLKILFPTTFLVLQYKSDNL